MYNETTVTLQGRVGGDVHLRQAGGATVAHFRVAVTPRRRHRQSGEWSDGPTQWWSVSAWRGLAEHCAASLHRGDAVVVVGRVDMRTYVTRAGVEALDVAVEALTVGHDLTRGTSAFTRTPRPAPEAGGGRPGEEASPPPRPAPQEEGREVAA